MLPFGKIRVFAFYADTGLPVLGGAANITAKWSKDYATPQPTTSTTPVEIEDGYYYFDLTLSERSVEVIGEIFPESSTPGVQVVGIPPYFFAPSYTSGAPENGAFQNVFGGGGATLANQELILQALERIPKLDEENYWQINLPGGQTAPVTILSTPPE
jgi:hypothetical protein